MPQITEIPKRITDFISENEVLTIATSSANIPYCATMFYVYSPEKNRLIFMSDVKTKHIQDALQNSRVAGSIIAKNVRVAKVQGLQFSGILSEPENHFKEEFSSKYSWVFPMATLHRSSLWTIELTFLKLTDYRLGFGKKLVWRAE